jgi:CRP/FNR family cyclic AMP-dependent transcriptional regulator
LDNEESILLPEEMAVFKSLSKLMHVKKGYILFAQEGCNDFIYFIELGHVKIYKNTDIGKVLTTSIYSTGAVIGIAGVLMGKSHSVYAETIEKCKLWRMHGTDFIEMLQSHPQLAIRIAAMQSQRLREAERVIGNLMYREVDRRLAWLLMDLAGTASYPPANWKAKINIRLTHQDMASMIGTSRQTVTSILNRFKTEGIVNVGGHCIEIIDINKLGKYAV